jgi:HEAT repeat protein
VSQSILGSLASLLEDANDEVKIETMSSLAKLGATGPEFIEGLCKRLREDDSVEVQAQAALALARLGPAAVYAGEALVRAAQTGDANVRERAMRAIAIIQPPEATQAFITGLRDGVDDVRLLASAGLIKAPTVSAEAIPTLIEALRDPAVQVRANAAKVLAGLDAVPADAVPLLIECAANDDEGLRMNAAMALKLSSDPTVSDLMQQLLGDPSSRVREIAASYSMAVKSDSAKAVYQVCEPGQLDARSPELSCK